MNFDALDLESDDERIDAADQPEELLNVNSMNITGGCGSRHTPGTALQFSASVATTAYYKIRLIHPNGSVRYSSASYRLYRNRSFNGDYTLSANDGLGNGQIDLIRWTGFNWVIVPDTQCAFQVTVAQGGAQSNAKPIRVTNILSIGFRGYCLDVDPMTGSIKAVLCNGRASQNWQIDNLHMDHYRIRNAATHTCLKIDASGLNLISCNWQPEVQVSPLDSLGNSNITDIDVIYRATYNDRLEVGSCWTADPTFCGGTPLLIRW